MEENIASSIFTENFEGQVRYEPGTKQQRFINYIVDAVLYYVVFYELLSLSGNPFDKAGSWEDKGYVLLTICIGMLPFYAITEAVSGGRSLGKFITGTVAVKKDLSPINSKDAFVRSLLRMLPVDSLSGLFGAPLHDKWSGTMVVKKNSIVF
jgi:uncharacterized RDD family membrane protein YckC